MKNVQTSAKRSFVTQWVIGSFIGWILGALTLFLVPAIWEIFTTITYQYYRESVWYKEVWSSWLGDMIFSLLALGGLFLMVVVMGLVQWQIALKAKINKRLWVFSTVLSITLGAIALIIGIRIIPPPFSFHPGNFSGLDDTLSVNDTWLFVLSAAFGNILGISWVIVSALITDSTSPETLGVALAQMSITPWVGIVIGLSLGGVAIHALEIMPALLLAMFVGIIALFLVRLIPFQQHE